MKYRISCSIGEIIDKFTILQIKKENGLDREQLINIETEMNSLIKEVSLISTNDFLFQELYRVNKKLWLLEDSIREKSREKLFDKEYIDNAEQIHKTNDERYLIKRKINIKYNSELKEEKIYSKREKIQQQEKPDAVDIEKLNIGKQAYSKGDYNLSYMLLKEVMEKYKNYSKEDEFMIDLLFAYEIIVTFYNKENKYFGRIEKIMKKIDKLEISSRQKHYCHHQFANMYLFRHNYISAGPYLNTTNYIIGPGINYDNMSFFKLDDKNKVQFIYEGGGIGDKFMLSRFIPQLCKKYIDNKILLMLPDNIVWIFKDIFSVYDNLVIVPESKKNLIYFDYHCSLMMLIYYLNISYKDIYFEPLFKNLNYEPNNYIKQIILQAKQREKTYILNWKGNPQNLHEITNRRMSLKCAKRLFEIENITWIIITKDISMDEREIIEKYKNIINCGEKIDKEDAFRDSIYLMKKVDGVISTDTAIVHLAANLDVKTFACLTEGTEWRWTRGESTRWYPKITMLRQKEQGDWTNVITELIDIIKLN